jgi:hypothetical protein
VDLILESLDVLWYLKGLLKLLDSVGGLFLRGEQDEGNLDAVCSGQQAGTDNGDTLSSYPSASFGSTIAG